MTAPGTRPVINRRLRRLAAVSLVLNAFLLAFAGAQVWRGRVGPGVMLQPGQLMEREPPVLLLEAVASALPPADAAILRNAMAAAMPQLREARAGFAGAMAQLRVEIRREPVNRAALEADITGVMRQRERLNPAIETVLKQALPAMSLEARQAISRYRVGQ